MAAYAALISLMNDLELIPNHPTHSFSFDTKQISSLFRTVHFLIDFMETYDSNACGREAAEILEGRIASAAHAAHDVIESHIVDQIHSGSTLLDVKETSYYFLDSVKTRVKKFGSTLLGVARYYYLPDLQKAIDDMEFVKREAVQFKVKAQSDLEAEQLRYSASTSSQPLTSDNELTVGFDVVAVRLLDMLIGEPSNQLSIIPIVGMGGIGKTTLAKYANKHLLIQQHFDCLLWATISQEYSVENILRQLLFRETGSATGGNFSELGVQLHQKLIGRRYFVVLDDMWSVKAWDEIKLSLPDNENGSRVIITTRLLNLAAHLSSSPLEMTFLDNDTSWELFRGKAFGDEDCPVELEKIGKEIVKRCLGLPLSIVVIGGHFRKSSREIQYWEKVANFMNPISSLLEDEQCLNIIRLSYEHLPIYLKPCFLYMGIYLKDGCIDVSELVKFWVAEGFIKTKKDISLEEVAEDYLRDFIDMNLIFVRERRWDGKVESCVIHDIVRELCLKVAKKEKFLSVVVDTTQAIGKECRIVISKELLPLKLPPMLRSLVGRGKWYLDKLPVDLRLLRLLSKVNISDAPNFEQANLRYLAFSCEKRTYSRESKKPAPSSLESERIAPSRLSFSVERRASSSFQERERSTTSFSVERHALSSSQERERSTSSFFVERRALSSFQERERSTTSFSVERRALSSSQERERSTTSSSIGRCTLSSFQGRERSTTSSSVGRCTLSSFQGRERSTTSSSVGRRALSSSQGRERSTTSSSVGRRALSSSQERERSTTSFSVERRASSSHVSERTPVSHAVSTPSFSHESLAGSSYLCERSVLSHALSNFSREQFERSALSVEERHARHGERPLFVERHLSGETHTLFGERPVNTGHIAQSLCIPSSISLMWNMQTLIIHNYDMEISEPFAIWEMPQLRHLEFVRGSIRQPTLGDRLNKLQNLHTLLGVLNLRLTEEVCKRMPNLKKLSVEYNQFPSDDIATSFYCPQNFILFNKLESLHCSFSADSKWRAVALDLRFPMSSLEEVSLQHSQLYWGELTTMIESLSRLGSLSLDSVRGSEWDLAEQEFSRLKVLRISRCDDLVEWNANSFHFPVLEILHISEVPKLGEIPSDIGEIPTLTRIELIGSNASLAASATSIVAEQESLGNQKLQLDIGFSDTEELKRFEIIVQEEGLSISG